MNIFKYKKLNLLVISILCCTYGFSQEIEKSIFITGNTWNASNTEVLSQIVKDAKVTSNPELLILGNATPKSEFKNSIKKQLEAVQKLGKNVIFMPGNHEWALNGHRGVSDIEKYIQKNSKAKFYPDDSAPIKHHNLSENIVLISVDSQWFLQDWNNDTYINEDTAIKNRTLFFLEFQNRIKKAQGKLVLVAIHHPIETKTRQGFIGDIAGFSKQDFQNKQYTHLRNRLKTIARSADHVIFLSGHDKNLQYLNNHVPQIISGAAGSLDKTKKAEEGTFTSSENGYSRLDVNADGKVTVQFFVLDNGSSKKVYQNTIFKGNIADENPSYTIKDNFPATQPSSIYTKEATKKGGFYKALWGNHYREYYGKDVNAPVALLDTLRGGVTPVKRGGGQQSKSLRLVDKTGKQFVMRALKKSTIQFLQASAFQETYIGSSLDGTVLDKFLADFYTTSHPFVPYAITGLSDAANVNIMMILVMNYICSRSMLVIRKLV